MAMALCPECSRAVDVFEHDGALIFAAHLGAGGGDLHDGDACPSTAWLVEAEDLLPDDTGPAHGTLAGYTKRGCRCDACRLHMATYQRQRRAATPRPPRPTPQHGTYARYQLTGDPCRCSDCRAASAAYHRQRRARLAEPTHPHRGAA